MSDSCVPPPLKITGSTLPTRLPYCRSRGSGTQTAGIFLSLGPLSSVREAASVVGRVEPTPPKYLFSASNRYPKLIIAKYRKISCKKKYLETLFVFRVLGAARQSLALPCWAPQGCWQCPRPGCRGNTGAVAWGQAGHEGSALVSPSQQTPPSPPAPWRYFRCTWIVVGARGLVLCWVS